MKKHLLICLIILSIGVSSCGGSSISKEEAEKLLTERQFLLEKYTFLVSRPDQNQGALAQINSRILEIDKILRKEKGKSLKINKFNPADEVDAENLTDSIDNASLPTRDDDYDYYPQDLYTKTPETITQDRFEFSTKDSFSDYKKELNQTYSSDQEFLDPEESLYDGSTNEPQFYINTFEDNESSSIDSGDSFDSLLD